MTDILNEVLSDKNEERKVMYFKKALPIVGVITLVIIIGMVINNIRTSSREKYNMETGDTLVQALDNMGAEPKTTTEAITYLMNDAENHVKDLAALQMLAMQIANKDTDMVLEILQKMINEKGYDELTQNYAKLMWISIMFDSKKTLEPENQEFMEKYFTAFESEEAPFYGSGNILKALYYKNTDNEKAAKILEKIISSKRVGPINQDEARALLSSITLN